MPNTSPSRKAAALLLSGVAIGAGGGYAVTASGASFPGAQPEAAHAHDRQAARRGGRAGQRARSGGGSLARLKRAVSITAVVPTRHGFATLSIQRGVLLSRAGAKLTLREGTRTSAYKTVNVTLPATARVRLARRLSSLDALDAGAHIAVIKTARRTVVIARPALRARKGAAASAASQG